MKRFVRKLFSMGALCLVLLSLPGLLGACSLQENYSSFQTYEIVVSRGTCTSWSFVDTEAGGGVWCAEKIPSIHAGDHVRLSYGALFQNFLVDGVDAGRHLVTVGSF